MSISIIVVEEDKVMPQYDMYHDTVKRALQKDGWTITHDPFILRYGRKRVYADLGAEQLISFVLKVITQWIPE